MPELFTTPPKYKISTVTVGLQLLKLKVKEVCSSEGITKGPGRLVHILPLQKRPLTAAAYLAELASELKPQHPAHFTSLGRSAMVILNLPLKNLPTLGSQSLPRFKGDHSCTQAVTNFMLKTQEVSRRAKVYLLVNC